MAPSESTPVAVTVSEFQKYDFEKDEIFLFMLDLCYPAILILSTKVSPADGCR